MNRKVTAARAPELSGPAAGRDFLGDGRLYGTIRKGETMAKRRTISYRDTARLAVVCGAASALAVGARLALSAAGDPLPWLDPTLGTLGIVAWFLGTAAGVLAVSTPHRRTAVVGLVLCGVALVGFAVLFVTSGTLAEAGYGVGSVTERASGDAASGQIIEQDPIAGTSAARDSLVDLVIAE